MKGNLLPQRIKKKLQWTLSYPRSIFSNGAKLALSCIYIRFLQAVIVDIPITFFRMPEVIFFSEFYLNLSASIKLLFDSSNPLKFFNLFKLLQSCSAFALTSVVVSAYTKFQHLIKYPAERLDYRFIISCIGQNLCL